MVGHPAVPPSLRVVGARHRRSPQPECDLVWSLRGNHVQRVAARPPRGRCPLRSPDSPLEPQDEAVHLRREERGPHHRSAEDGSLPRGGQPLRHWSRRPGWQRALRGNQARRPGRCCRRGRAWWHVLREQPLARRHADQLPDGQEVHRALRGPREGSGRRSLRDADQEGRPRPSPPHRQDGSLARWHQDHEGPARSHVRHRPQAGAHRRPRGPQAEDPHRGALRHQL